MFDNYPKTHRAAVPGMVANTRPKDVVSRLCQDAGGIGFAQACYRGTADNQVTSVPSAAFEGIAIRDVTLVHKDTTKVDKYIQGENCGVLRKGVIWVVASVAVAKGDPVYVTPAKAFTNIANAGANFLVPRAQWDSTAALGAIARVEVS